MMRITVGALMLALGISLSSRAADDAGADLLSREDVCALAEGIARSRIQDLEGSSIADSSCTKSTASIDGRIALDVIVSWPDQPLRTRPLQRGELCGGRDFIVACDQTDRPSKCSTDRKLSQHGKLRIDLQVETSQKVAATAAVLPYDAKPCAAGMRCGVASPCGGDRRARFERIDGHWKEVWNRFSKKPASPRSAVDAGTASI